MEERTLFDYWLVLYRCRYIIILIVFSSMTFAYFLSKSLPPVYEAKAVCFIPYNNSLISFYSPDAPKQMARGIVIPPSKEEFFAPFIGILKSKTLAKMVHKEFPQKKLTDLLRKDVDFQLNDEYMLEIYVRDRDPELAANIANAYVKYFNTLLSDYSLTYTNAYIRTLETEIKKVTKQLNETQTKLENFQKKHEVADLDEQMRQLILQKANFEKEISETKVALEEIDRQIESTPVELIKEAKLYLPSALSVTSPLIESLKQKLSDLEAKMAALKVEYLEEHPEFLKMKKEYEETKASLKQEIDRVIKSKVKSPNSFYEKLRQDLVGLYVNKECLKAKLLGYNKVLKGIEKTITDIPRLKIQQDNFKNEIDRLQNSLNTLKLALNEAKAQKQRSMQEVVVVDEATPPSAPVFPIWWLNVLVAGISGFIVGIFYAFLLDYIKRKHEEQTIGLLDLIKMDKYIN